ncbi:MAG TPA: single-stranded DNA-binding protein [Streptosporangiaceae bacterium]|jgi:single-strand DNA-binding protein|nr:single-stranded DNA-binding protein [Streptosporangiaceae bacterium]
MLNGATVTLAGYVAREPVYTTVNDTIPKVIVRVAWNNRYPDRVTGEWRDGRTSFATVNCWRKMADNAMTSLRKGQPVVVSGRLLVREYEDKEGKRRIAVDIEADAIGHDLNRGVSHFQRVRSSQEGADAQAQHGGPFTGADVTADGAPGLVLAGQVLPDGAPADGQRDEHGLDGLDSQGGRGADDILDTAAVAELAGAVSGSAGVAVPF